MQISPGPAAMLRGIFGDAAQLSYVVNDLDATLRFWTENLGVGPFVVIEDAAKDRIIAYRGQRSRVTMSLAFSYVGNVQIELVTARSTDPTPWTDFLASGREGLHHMGFWPSDHAAACARLDALGFALSTRIETEDGKLSAAYFEGPAHFGHMVELAPDSPARMRYFGGIRKLAETWDGTRPVRRFASRKAYLASDDCRP
ncbi:VOC family protein [Paracoccus versutus]|uniref:Catechol 2,3-dioxygenase-like lactoylglutathione lyase family enzyme n=1 Tax=Paracoccus versutus TaxID=34007 RepID=A0A3D9XYF8_PARVE|nr:VOC family protein [Paracoccus versutus]REF73302.1 catechol 2,3-dioxygenase-like lactoylglutathione lyase family enzyme [Paracoccus versutus]WGR54673.1 hypothetical protein E3U25_00780 [Paracoccus versutus]